MISQEEDVPNACASQATISSVSRGSSFGIRDAVRQLMIRREHTSVTNAVKTMPVQVGN